MRFFNKIFNNFNEKPKHKKRLKQKKKAKQSDIKFSTLIESIQKDIVITNQSLNCVGLEFIKQFFDKVPEINLNEVINQKFSAIEAMLNTKDTIKAKKLLSDLKVEVDKLNNQFSKETVSYRPKMTSFEIPIHSNGVWEAKSINIPLLALSPMPMPKIKELTFTSNFQFVANEGEDVYVRILEGGSFNNNENINLADEDVTKLKISITPEQSNEELNDIISHYEELLRPH